MRKSRYLVLTSDYLLPLLIIISTLTLLVLTFTGPIFRINHIDCNLDYRPCGEATVTAELDKFMGSNLFLLSPDTLRTHFTSAEFTIRDLEVVKSLPGTLTVYFQSVYPSFAVVQDGDKRFVLIDSKYRVIGLSVQNPNVPILEVNSFPPFRIGSLVDAKISDALEACQQIGNLISGVESYRLTDSLEVKMDTGLRIYLNPGTDLPRELDLLQAVLVDHTITSTISVVDLRFSQVVVK